MGCSVVVARGTILFTLGGRTTMTDTEFRAFGESIAATIENCIVRAEAAGDAKNAKRMRKSLAKIRRTLELD